MIDTLKRVLSKRAIALLVVALVPLLSACSRDSGTGPNQDPEGTYTLSDVDDLGVPVTIYNGSWVDHTSGAYYASYIVEVSNAAIEMDDTGQYGLIVVGNVIVDGVPGPAYLVSGGTYELDGRDITLSPSQGAPIHGWGTLKGNTLEIDLDIMSRGATNHYTFRR